MKTPRPMRPMLPKATKEFVLNHALNRWQLNYKKNVGPTSESIRTCKPRSRGEWAKYYYANVRSKHHIDGLGKILYEKVRDVLPGECRFHPDLLASITQQDCLAYVHQLVIDRTYDGYRREFD